MALRPESLETPGLDNVGFLTSHNPVVLHGLLWGQIYFYFYLLLWCVFVGRKGSGRSRHGRPVL
jgi:hypothetical protein